MVPAATPACPLAVPGDLVVFFLNLLLPDFLIFLFCVFSLLLVFQNKKKKKSLSLNSGTEILLLLLFSPIYILSFHAFTHPLTTRYIITLFIRCFITINQHMLWGFAYFSCLEVFCVSSVQLCVSGFLLNLQELNVISLSLNEFDRFASLIFTGRQNKNQVFT